MKVHSEEESIPRKGDTTHMPLQDNEHNVVGSRPD